MSTIGLAGTVRTGGLSGDSRHVVRRAGRPLAAAPDRHTLAIPAKPSQVTHTETTGEYGSRPSYGEFAAILAAGLTHILIEIGFSALVASAYNAAVSMIFLLYLVWRFCRTPGLLRVWGFRRDNFWPAMLAQLRFVAIGLLALIAYAAATDSLALPNTFWLIVALYPAWGIAQQFALQNLIATNLSGLLSGRFQLAVGSAALFAVSHYPRLDLVALAFVAGIFFTLTYRRIPNLWAVGIAHGILGSLAFYIVLGEDPGAAILRFFMDD